MPERSLDMQDQQEKGDRGQPEGQLFPPALFVEQFPRLTTAAKHAEIRMYVQCSTSSSRQSVTQE